MKLLILGCGRVGGALACMFSREGHDVTIMDRDVESFRRLDPDYKGKKSLGNVIDEDMLLAAGLADSDAVIAVTNGDNTNIMAVEIAKVKFKVPRALARIKDPLRAKTYREFGISTICHTEIIAKIVRDAVLNNKEGDLLCM